ncbi:DUF2798 domain-containing protein [Sphingobacterium sp. SGR-19]|uniref:DUF2798 domain-containing protein n=1 Tax=Sphingobacterium sp. SGR-19 TaxID=2710886 RepID=UPI0013EA4DDF|nr:DUF2798 domain-containing protein [Sphingobacterium sp. SGR-19]NGM64145.1 DUF2798 domain-containing protein [Sphingobacterium sp. SGR-19]
MVNSKEDRRYRIISTLFVVLPTTFLMSFLSSITKEVLTKNWINELFKSWLISIPVVYACVIVLLPLANRITSKLLDRKVQS